MADVKTELKKFRELRDYLKDLKDSSEEEIQQELEKIDDSKEDYSESLEELVDSVTDEDLQDEKEDVEKLLKSFKKLTFANNFTDSLKLVNNIILNLKNLRDASKEDVKKEFKELDRMFKALNKFVKNRANELANNEVESGKVKNVISVGLEGSVELEGFEEEFNSRLEGLNRNAESKLKSIKKSKEKKYAPLYVKLMNYCNNYSNFLQFMNEHVSSSELKNLIKHWREEVTTYQSYSQKGEDKGQRLLDKVMALGEGLRKYNQLLDNLIQVCRKLEGSNEKVFKPLFNFEEPPDKKKLRISLDNYRKRLDEVDIQYKIRTKFDESRFEGEREHFKKAAEAMVELFDSFLSVLDDLKYNLNRLAIGIGNMTNLDSGEEKLAKRKELMEKLKKTLNNFKELSKQSRELGMKFRRLKDAYKGRLDRLEFKFGLNVNSLEKTSKLLNNMEDVLKKTSKKPKRLKDELDKVDVILEGARDLEKKLKGREIIEEYADNLNINKLNNLTRLRGKI